MKLRTLLFATLMLLLIPALMAHGNKPGKAELAVGSGTITVEYVGPALKGRDIDELLNHPRANPWRLGADAPTMLKTPVALQFGDSTLEAGSYTLRAARDDSNNWWLQAVDSSSQVAGKLPLESVTASNSEENMVIHLKGDEDAAHFMVQWGERVLKGGFAVAD